MGENRVDTCQRLMAAHGPAVRRLAAATERDPMRQQDLVQEIWLAVWQALPRFRGECAERTFVFRIAHNRAVTHVDHWSRRRMEPIEDSERLSSAGPDPEQHLASRQRHAWLHEAVAALPLTLRQVIVLTLEGLSHREVADVVGISENNVAVRLSRARAMLAEALRPLEHAR